MPLTALGHIPLVISVVKSAETTKLRLIRIEQDDMVGGPLCADSVILERLVRVEVENKECRALFVGDKLVFLHSQGGELVL